PEHAIARAFDRAPGHERAGARGLEADEIDESGRMRQRGHDRGLGGDVDEIAAAGGVAMKERNQRADGGLRAGPAVGLRLPPPRPGMPPGPPASAMAPPAAMSSMSLAFHALRGPTPPNGRMATTTNRG